MRLAILAALGLASAPTLAAPNHIVADGRTNTRISVNDDVTNIRTGTTSGDVAFNSFSHFKLSNSHTANLFLPKGTDNLVNLVHDSRAVINGHLNSILDGKIGGHVVFADPNGIVVGSQGVLNVGSLMLTTPNRQFMNRVVGADGSIDMAATQELLSGQAPSSAKGRVRVKGQVNASSSIQISAAGVSVNGDLRAATPKAHQALFQASVNTDGMAQGVAVSKAGGSIHITADHNVQLEGHLSAASTDQHQGSIQAEAGDNLTLAGTASLDTSAVGTQGDGGQIKLHAGKDLHLDSGATLAAAGATQGGDGGSIDSWSDGNTTVAAGVHFDASAGATGDGGSIEVSGAKNVSLDGLNADLASGADGKAGKFLVDPVTVSATSKAYYTNGGDVDIVASDSITLDDGAVINTRQVETGGGADVTTGELGNPGDNPAGMSDPAAANDVNTASVGDSGNVVLQAPEIEVGKNAQINTFATNGHDAGDITLTSGSNFTCNICKVPPKGYFDNISQIGTPLTAASTDDVSITVKKGAELDARYRDTAGYTGSSGKGGDVSLKADASDLQVAGFSMAGAKIKVDGILRGANVDVSATAKAGVDFGWLASVLDDPSDPTSKLTLLQQMSNVDVSQFFQNTVQNADDWTDITNVAGVLGLPVTAGVAIADAKVTVGKNAVLEAANDVSVTASATRSVDGALGGGVLSGSMPEVGFGVIYGHVSGDTSVEITDGADITAGGDFNVEATSQNSLSVGASAEVTQPKNAQSGGGQSGNEKTPKGNKSLAFSAGIGYVNTSTTAKVDKGVVIHKADAVNVKATNVDKFSVTSSSKVKTPKDSKSKTQGGVSFAVGIWNTTADASFNARLPGGVTIGSLNVVADNVADTHVTKSTVKSASNVVDFLVGKKADRKTAIDGLLSGAFKKAGGKGAPKFAAAAAITVSHQTAHATIGEDAVVRANKDVTVRSRVVDQGIRSIADSRVNSTGPGAASRSGSVAFAYSEYHHDSQAQVGNGAVIAGDHIGIGARSLLPIDNDYDQITAQFDPTTWSGPSDFLGALNTIVGDVTSPNVPAMESFGLPMHLLTGYSNAYGDAKSDGTAIFGAANALVVNQRTRAWVGSGAQLTANASSGSWTTDFPINVDKDSLDGLDISAPDKWTWSAPVAVDAKTTTKTIGVTGNLSLLTIIASRNAPPGNGVGGSFGWNQFHTNTIAGIGDGAVVNTDALEVKADSINDMFVIAPSAGQGKSMAGNGIFSYAQIDGKTHASISHNARINADSIDVLANFDINLWAIGGAVAVSSKNSMGAAIAANSINMDTRAYIGDNRLDRIPADGEDTNGDGFADQKGTAVSPPGGVQAGLQTKDVTVKAQSQGQVGAIAVAAAAKRPGGKTGGAGGSSGGSGGTGSGSGGETGVGQGLTPNPSTPDTGSTKTPESSGSSSFSAAGSGTLNFSKMNTIAEIRDTNFIVNKTSAAPDITVNALAHVDQVSASGSAAVSMGGGQGKRSTALSGALAFNNIDQQTRAGIYGMGVTGAHPVIGNVNVLSATYGQLLSLGLGLAASSGSKSSGAALSGSYGNIDADTTSEVEDSTLKAAAATDSMSVTGYDHSRVMVGGGAFYLGLGSKGTGGVGLAASIGRVDNDVSAYVRGSTIKNYDTLDVHALGASRVLAGAFGGAVNTGKAPSGAGSFYLIMLDSDLSAGITGSYAMVDDDGDPDTPKVPDYNQLQKKSHVTTHSGVDVAAKSRELSALDTTITQGGFDNQVDFAGGALSNIDADQAGFDPDKNGVKGEAVLGFAGSLAISGGKSAAGFAVGYMDLDGSYTADVRDADITVNNGDLAVTATNGRQAIGVAVGAAVSGSGKFTANGSVAHTSSNVDVNASVLGNSNITADHVKVKAAADGVIYSLAGSLSVSASGKAAVGAAVTDNHIGGKVGAHLGGNSITANAGSDSVVVSANQESDIRTAAVSASASAKLAASGSATTNELTTKNTATLDASTVDAKTVRVTVANGSPGDRSSVMSLAGSLTASSKAGFGAAVAVNTLSRDFNASVNNTHFVNTDSLQVLGSSAAAVKTFAASGGASGKVSAGVSNVTTTGTGSITAAMTGASLNNPSADVLVHADDSSSIDSLAGAVQIGRAAVGVASAVNDLGTDVSSSISGGSLTARNATVESLSHDDINTLAVGVSLSSKLALSGSVAVNRINSTTSSLIDSGAKITAAHNVGVLAKSHNSIDLAAGAAGVSATVLGGAGSVTVNLLNNDTTAAIKGASTHVIAHAQDASDTISYTGGELGSSPSGNPFSNFFGDGSDAKKPELDDFSSYTPTPLLAAKKKTTGVVVDAISLQQTTTLEATLGFSADFVKGAGVSLVANTTVVDGTTKALVEDATIGDSNNPASVGNLTVSAGNHAYGTDIVLGAAASSVGVVAAADVSTYNGEATAALHGADVQIGGDLSLNAVSHRQQLGVVAGVAVGTWAGVSGSGLVSIFGGQSTAEITGNSNIDANDIALDADNSNKQDLYVVGLAGSAGGAGSGTVAVAVDQSETTARIGDGKGHPDVGASGDVTIQADNHTHLNTVTASAAVSGTTSLAGAIGVQYIGNTTKAGVYGATLTADGGLDVLANDHIDAKSIAGSASITLSPISTVAGAIGVNIGVAKSATKAQIDHSDVTTGGAVNVKATRDGAIDFKTIVASASFGGTAAVSGGVGVLLMGGSLDNDINDNTDGDLSDELGPDGGDWIGKSDDYTSDDHLTTKDDSGDSVDRTGGALGRLRPGADTRPGNGDFTSLQDAAYGVGDDGVEAGIVGGTVKAGSLAGAKGGDQPITVKAEDKLHTSNKAAALAVGGWVSAGGGVAVTQVNSQVIAQSLANRLDASTLTVNAVSKNGSGGDAINVAGYAGAAGLVGIGAAVGVGVLNGEVQSSIGGDIYLRDGVNVTADDKTDITAQAKGASLSLAAAVGVAVAVASRNTTVNATTAEDTNLQILGSNASTLDGVSLTATALGHTDSDAFAAAGGLFAAGNGSVAVTSDNRTIKAGVGKNSVLDSRGDITVLARNLPDISAVAKGGSGSLGASFGTSVAVAKSNATLDAYVGDDTDLTFGRSNYAGTLTVKANQKAFNSQGTWASGYDDASVTAEAYTANGGLLSANGSVATIKDGGKVSSSIGDGVDISNLQATGNSTTPKSNIVVSAEREAALFGKSTGIVGGAVAAGASVTDVSSDSNTRAYFGGQMAFWAQSVKVNATSTTDMIANAISGSGGIVAGAAAKGSVSDTADATAEIGGGSKIAADEVNLLSHHLSRVLPITNSIQAAVVGGSGSTSEIDIDSNVLTQVDNGSNNHHASILGYSVALRSDNDVKQESQIADAPDSEYSVLGGTGGAINGASADGVIDVTKKSRVKVGDYADLTAYNRPDATKHQGLATLIVQAGGSINVNDRVKLTAGGGIEAPWASSKITVDGTTHVGVGDHVRMNSGDLLGISAYESQAAIDSDTVTTAGGGVGFAGSKAIANVDYDQTVTVGSNSDLMGNGYVYITAGRSADTNSVTTPSLFRINAVAETYNWTAAPLDTAKQGSAHLNHNATVTVGAGSTLKAGWDMVLGGADGSVYLTGKGVGHNPYLSLFSTQSSSHDESKTIKTGLTMNGTAIAGYYHDWDFSVKGSASNPYVVATLNGEPLPNSGSSSGNYWGVGSFDPGAKVDDLKQQLLNLDSSYQVLVNNMPTAGLPASAHVVDIQGVTATQGDIKVLGDSLSGAGTLEAHGGASIDVSNSTTAWLNVGNLNVVKNHGGNVLFLGAATAAAAPGVDVKEVGSGDQAVIRVTASGNTGQGSAQQQPGLTISNPLENQLGLIRLFNRNGNIYQGTLIEASQVQIVAPNGTVVIIAPHSFERAGGTPWSVWKGAEMNVSARDVIAYALIDDLKGRGYTVNNSAELEDILYHHNWIHGSIWDTKPDDPDDYHTDHYKGSIVPYNKNDATGSNATYDHYELFTDKYRDATFQHVPYHPLSISANYDDVSHSTDSGIRAQRVLVAAKVFNVNAPIKAGRLNDVTINLDNSVKQRIANWNSTDEMDLVWYHETGAYASYRAIASALGLPLPAFAKPAGWYLLDKGDSVPDTSDRIITGRYDPATGNITMSGIQGAATGYINIDAKIISTSKNGELDVVNGFSNINIDNQTPYNLVLNDVSTGTASTGVIVLTDRLKGRRTWYVHHVGGGVQKYTTSDLNTATWQAPNVSRQNTGLHAYSPKEGVRFWWNRRYQAKRKLESTNYFDGKLTNWEFADGNWKTGTTGAFDGDIDGEYGICTTNCRINTNKAFAQKVISSSWSGHSIYYHFTYGESVDNWSDVDGTSGHWHKFTWPLYASLRTHSSVKADYPIDIKFSGNSNGTINVNSDADVTLTGRLRSVAGSVNVAMSDGAILNAADKALISAESINLSAAAGTGTGGQTPWVGTEQAPVNVNLLGSGASHALSASAPGNIFIDAPASAMRVDQVDGGGTVSLSAGKSLLSTNTGVAVTGDRVVLSAAGGRIGALSSGAMKVNATARLDAQALNDIALTQPQDDMKLGVIKSLKGDVSLTAADGNMVSVTNKDLSDLISLQDLETKWKALGLVGSAADTKADKMVKAYEHMVESRYRRYWQLSGVVQDKGGQLTVTDAGIRLYRGLSDASGKGTSDAAVADYVIDQYQQLKEFFEGVYSTPDLSSVNGFSSYDDNWQFTASTSKQQALTKGVKWKVRQLQNAINMGAVSGGGAGVSWLDDTVNVTGNNVTLNASGNIGEADAHQFTLSQNNTINNSQRRWLLAAAPGGVTIDESTSQPGGYNINVRTLSRLRIDAEDSLDARAGDASNTKNIFIGADGTTHIKQLQADGRVYLGSGKDISYAPNADVLEGASDGLVLKAVSGSITGPDNQYFDLDIDGTLTAAVAGGDIKLNKLNKDLKVGILNAQGMVAVKVPNGDLQQVQGQGYRITGTSLKLNVSGDAGSAGGPLHLAMDALIDSSDTTRDGTIFGEVGGSLYIDSPTHDVRLSGSSYVDSQDKRQSRHLKVGNKMVVDADGGNIEVGNKVDVDQSVTLHANKSLTFDKDSLLSAGGNMALTADRLDMGEGSLAVAGKRITLQSTQDASLSHLKSLLTGTTSNAPAIDVASTQGDILSVLPDQQVNLETAASQGVRLTASQGAVGSDNAPLVIDAPKADVAKAKNDIHLLALSDMTSDRIYSVNGKVVLNGQGALQLQYLKAGGGTLNVNAATSLGLAGKAESQDQMRLNSGTDMTVGGSLTSVNAGIVATAGGNMTFNPASKATSKKDQIYHAHGKMALGILSASDGNITADTATGDLSNTSSKAGGTIDFDSAAKLQFGSLTAGNQVQTRSATSTEGDTVEAGNNVVMTAGTDMDLNRVTSHHGKIDLFAFGDINANRLTSDDDRILVSALGSVDLGQLESAGNQQLDAAYSLTLDKAVSHHGNIQAHAAQGDMQVNDSLFAGGYIKAAANGDIAITNKAKAGDYINLTAQNDLTFGALDAGTTVDSESRGDTKGQTVHAGDNIHMLAAGDMNLHQVTSDNSKINLRAIHDMVADMLQSPGKQQLKSGRNMKLGTAASGDTQTMNAGGWFHFGKLDAQGWIISESRGDTVGNKVRSHAGVRMTAGQRAHDQVADGSLLITRLQAPEAYLRAADRLIVDDLYQADKVELRGNRISSHIHNPASGHLQGLFKGGNGGLAGDVDLWIDGTQSVAFSEAYAKDAFIDTTASHVELPQGWITEKLRLNTPKTQLLMDNTNPTSKPLDIQLYEPDHHFALDLEGKKATTDAYVTRYNLGWQVVLPNYSYTHEDQPLLVTGPSAERDAEKLMVLLNTSLPHIDLQWTPNMQTLIGSLSVNLNMSGFKSYQPVNKSGKHDKGNPKNDTSKKSALNI